MSPPKSILKRKAPLQENMEQPVELPRKKLTFRTHNSFVEWKAEGPSNTPTDIEDDPTASSSKAPEPIAIEISEVDPDAEEVVKNDKVFYKTYLPLNDLDINSVSSTGVETDGFTELDQLIPGYGERLKENLAYIVSIKNAKAEKLNDESQEEKSKKLNENLAEKLHNAKTTGQLLDQIIDNAYSILRNNGDGDELWDDLMKILTGQRINNIFHACIKMAYPNITLDNKENRQNPPRKWQVILQGTDHMQMAYELIEAMVHDATILESNIKEEIEKKFSTAEQRIMLITVAEKFPRLLLLISDDILKEMMQVLISKANSFECLMRLLVKNSYAIYRARDEAFKENDNYEVVYTKPLSVIRGQISSLKRSQERSDSEEKKAKKTEKIKESLGKTTPELGI
jgi:nitrogen regulatory protein PII-like uncharacterized protein